MEQWRKGKPEQKFDAGYGTIFLELVSFSKKQAKASYWFFSWTRQAKNLKTISAWTESADLIVQVLKKNIQLVTFSL